MKTFYNQRVNKQELWTLSSSNQETPQNPNRTAGLLVFIITEQKRSLKIKNKRTNITNGSKYSPEYISSTQVIHGIFATWSCS